MVSHYQRTFGANPFASLFQKIPPLKENPDFIENEPVCHG